MDKKTNLEYIEIIFGIGNYIEYKTTPQEIERILESYRKQEICLIVLPLNHDRHYITKTGDRHYINMSKVIDIKISELSKR